MVLVLTPSGPWDHFQCLMANKVSELPEKGDMRIDDSALKTYPDVYGHLQPIVYTIREVSQPAPITAAWRGYRVPEMSSVAMKGVRFSVKLA